MLQLLRLNFPNVARWPFFPEIVSALDNRELPLEGDSTKSSRKREKRSGRIRGRERGSQLSCALCEIGLSSSSIRFSGQPLSHVNEVKCCCRRSCRCCCGCCCNMLFRQSHDWLTELLNHVRCLGKQWGTKKCGRTWLITM